MTSGGAGRLRMTVGVLKSRITSSLPDSMRRSIRISRHRRITGRYSRRDNIEKILNPNLFRQRRILLWRKILNNDQNAKTEKERTDEGKKNFPWRDPSSPTAPQDDNKKRGKGRRTPFHVILSPFFFSVILSPIRQLAERVKNLPLRDPSPPAADQDDEKVCHSESQMKNLPLRDPSSPAANSG